MSSIHNKKSECAATVCGDSLIINTKVTKLGKAHTDGQVFKECPSLSAFCGHSAHKVEAVCTDCVDRNIDCKKGHEGFDDFYHFSVAVVSEAYPHIWGVNNKTDIQQRFYLAHFSGVQVTGFGYRWLFTKIAEAEISFVIFAVRKDSFAGDEDYKIFEQKMNMICHSHFSDEERPEKIPFSLVSTPQHHEVAKVSTEEISQRIVQDKVSFSSIAKKASKSWADDDDDDNSDDEVSENVLTTSVPTSFAAVETTNVPVEDVKVAVKVEPKVNNEVAIVVETSSLVKTNKVLIGGELIDVDEDCLDLFIKKVTRHNGKVGIFLVPKDGEIV